MFYDINRGLCETFHINPLELLNYPAEDVFELINQTIDYNNRHDDKGRPKRSGKIRRKANDNWF